MKKYIVGLLMLGLVFVSAYNSPSVASATHARNTACANILANNPSDEIVSICSSLDFAYNIEDMISDSPNLTNTERTNFNNQVLTEKANIVSRLTALLSTDASPLVAPVLTLTQLAGDNVSFSWTRSEGATSYELLRNYGTEDYTNYVSADTIDTMPLCGQTAKTLCRARSSNQTLGATASGHTDGSAKEPGNYTYTVVARKTLANGNKYAVVSNMVEVEISGDVVTDTVNPVLGTPTVSSAGVVTLSWTPVQSGVSYEVWRRGSIFSSTIRTEDTLLADWDDSGSNYCSVKNNPLSICIVNDSNVTGNSYQDSSSKPAGSYQYAVKLKSAINRLSNTVTAVVPTVSANTPVLSVAAVGNARSTVSGSHGDVLAKFSLSASQASVVVSQITLTKTGNLPTTAFTNCSIYDNGTELTPKVTPSNTGLFAIFNFNNPLTVTQISSKTLDLMCNVDSSANIPQTANFSLSTMTTNPSARMATTLPVNIGMVTAVGLSEIKRADSEIDMDGDGEFDIVDIGTISDVIRGAMSCPIGKHCDLNADGQVTDYDYNLMRRRFTSGGRVNYRNCLWWGTTPIAHLGVGGNGDRKFFCNDGTWITTADYDAGWGFTPTQVPTCQLYAGKYSPTKGAQFIPGPVPASCGGTVTAQNPVYTLNVPPGTISVVQGATTIQNVLVSIVRTDTGNTPVTFQVFIDNAAQENFNITPSSCTGSCTATISLKSGQGYAISNLTQGSHNLVFKTSYRRVTDNALVFGQSVNIPFTVTAPAAGTPVITAYAPRSGSNVNTSALTAGNSAGYLRLPVTMSGSNMPAGGKYYVVTKEGDATQNTSAQFTNTSGYTNINIDVPFSGVTRVVNMTIGLYDQNANKLTEVPYSVTLSAPESPTLDAVTVSPSATVNLTTGQSQTFTVAPVPSTVTGMTCDWRVENSGVPPYGTYSAPSYSGNTFTITANTASATTISNQFVVWARCSLPGGAQKQSSTVLRISAPVVNSGCKWWGMYDVSHGGAGTSPFGTDGTFICDNGVWRTSHVVTEAKVAEWGFRPVHIDACVDVAGKYAPSVSARFVPLVNGTKPGCSSSSNLSQMASALEAIRALLETLRKGL